MYYSYCILYRNSIIYLFSHPDLDLPDLIQEQFGLIISFILDAEIFEL